MSERRDTVGSAAWMVAGSLSLRVVDFARYIVIARLLAPDELGRFFLVVAVLAAAEVVTTPGLDDALIQRRERDEHVWQATWTFLVLRGLALTALLMACAGLIASLLDNPDIEALLRVAALLPFLRGLRSMSVVELQRNVDTREFVVLRVTAQLVGTVVSVACVLITDDAWGLVAGLLAAGAVEGLGSHVLPGFRARWRLSWHAIRGLIGFSRWRFASNWMWYASTQGTDLVVGKALGTGPLGIYRVSFRLANLPTTEVTDAVARVAFPALARAGEDSQAGARVRYRRYLVLTAGISGVLAALVAATAEPLVAVLLGGAYASAAVPLAIMSAAGFLRAIAATGGAWFLASGRPAYDTLMQAMRLSGLVVGLVLFLDMGVDGAALAVLISVVCKLPVWAWGVGRLGVPPAETVALVARRLPAPAIAGGLAFATERLLDAPAGIELIAAGTVGLAAWIAAVLVLDRPFAAELRIVAARFPALSSRFRPGGRVPV